MVRDSEKGAMEKKGQGQVSDELKLNPEWTSMKVRQGEKESGETESTWEGEIRLQGEKG